MGHVKSAPEIDPAPEGPQRAVCVDNYTRENCDTQWGKKDKEQFVFESEHVDPKTGKPFLLFATFIAIITPKAKLNAFLCSWRGKQFTKEEQADVDCERVVGANALVNVIRDYKDDGKVYANITSIMPLQPGMEKLKPSGNYTRTKDRKPGQGEAAHADPLVDDDIPF